MKQIQISIFFILSTILISCSSDDYLNSIGNFEGDHEEPSKVILQFENITNGEFKSFVYDMPEGTEESLVIPINLKKGMYNVTLFLFSANGDDLTEEIFEHDKEDHFVYYSKLTNSNVNVVYAKDDAQDSEQNKLGKKTIWSVTEGESFQFIYLIHQPAIKDFNALSTEQIGGEIDLEAKFIVKVKE